MKWISLNRMEQLEEIKLISQTEPVLIFKHSTRCSISSNALDRLERQASNVQNPGFKPFFLDLLAFRSISNQIENEFGIEHQSPQVLLIKNEKCVYNNSHIGINFSDLRDSLNSN